MELDETRFARGVDEPEGVHAEALHRPIASGDRAIGHRPHQHRGDLGHQRREVPERVVRRAGLGHREMRLGLRRMDQVGELHRVLDEEDRDVVADEVPVPLVRVELHREAADVARGVGRSAFAEDGRKADEYRRLLAGFREQRGARVLFERLVALEVAVRRRPSGVHDALGNPLVIEVGDLLAEDEVLEQRRPAQAGLERVLVVANGHALIGGQRPIGGVDADPIERSDGLVGADGRCLRCPPCPSRCISVTVLAVTSGSSGTSGLARFGGVAAAGSYSSGLLALKGKVDASSCVPASFAARSSEETGAEDLAAEGPLTVERLLRRTPVDLSSSARGRLDLAIVSCVTRRRAEYAARVFREHANAGRMQKRGRPCRVNAS